MAATENVVPDPRPRAGPARKTMELEIGEIIGAPMTMRDGQTVPVLVRVRREASPSPSETWRGQLRSSESSAGSLRRLEERTGPLIE